MTPTRLTALLALLTTSTLIVALGCAPSRARAADPQPNGGPGGAWSMIFDDEFSGTGVDLSVWQPNWFGSTDTEITQPLNAGHSDACTDPGMARVSNGALRLRVVRRFCQGHRYDGAVVNSNPAGGGNFQFTYGYIEFRAILPAEDGMWTAFWTNGQNWPTDGELDVMESGLPLASSQGWFYHGPNGVTGGRETIPGASTSWHTYAAFWEPGRISWYFDGDLVGTVTEGVGNVAHYIVLSASDWKSRNPMGPATTRVDYVRVWQPDPDPPPPAASVRVSGTTLLVGADTGVRDNLRISSPTKSTLRVTNYPSGPYAGSAVDAGAGCTDGGDHVVNCNAATIRRVKVLAEDRADKVVNATTIQSSFYGEGGDDVLLGGDNSDTFYGGPGANVLRGRSGHDDLFARNLTSDKLIDCGDDADKADLDELPQDPDSAVTSCESEDAALGRTSRLPYHHHRHRRHQRPEDAVSLILAHSTRTYRLGAGRPAIRDCNAGAHAMNKLPGHDLEGPSRRGCRARWRSLMATGAGAAQAFSAHGSVEQVYVTASESGRAGVAPQPRRARRSPRSGPTRRAASCFATSSREPATAFASAGRGEVGAADGALDAAGAAEHAGLQPARSPRAATAT